MGSSRKYIAPPLAAGALSPDRQSARELSPQLFSPAKELAWKPSATVRAMLR